MADKQAPDPPFVFRSLDVPKVAGTYWIGGVSVGVGFSLKRRPAWLHRLAMRIVFGWEWVDAINK